MRSPVTSSAHRTGLAALVAISLLAHADVSHAQPKPAAASGSAAPQADEARAQDLFKKSVEAYRRGDFKESVGLLTEAYKLQKEPVLLYNLGRAYEGLGDRAAALEAYKHYLQDEPKTPDRGAIEQRIVTLQRELDEVAALEKQRDEERQQAAEARRKQQEEAARNNKKTEPAPKGRSPLPYIVGGVGLLGVANGAFFGVMANGKHDDAVKEPVQTTAMGLQSDAKTYATVANVSYIAGGALIAAGVVLWVLDSPKKSASATGALTHVTLGVGPGNVVAAGTF